MRKKSVTRISLIIFCNFRFLISLLMKPKIIEIQIDCGRKAWELLNQIKQCFGNFVFGQSFQKKRRKEKL